MLMTWFWNLLLISGIHHRQLPISVHWDVRIFKVTAFHFRCTPQNLYWHAFRQSSVVSCVGCFLLPITNKLEWAHLYMDLCLLVQWPQKGKALIWNCTCAYFNHQQLWRALRFERQVHIGRVLVSVCPRALKRFQQIFIDYLLCTLSSM